MVKTRWLTICTPDTYQFLGIQMVQVFEWFWYADSHCILRESVLWKQKSKMDSKAQISKHSSK
jgi:hypothetical protein